MSRYDENLINLINPIDTFVPLHANPNRVIDVYGNLIRVKTQSGACYCFDGISPTPLFYNSARIYNITSDSSGNTIYVNYYGNNDITIFRVNLQGIIYRNHVNIHYDSSGNINNDSSGNINNDSSGYIYTDLSGNNIIATERTIATEGTTATEGTVATVSNVNIFSGSIIRKKIMEQEEDDICQIKHEQIGDCDIYMNCSCCNKNFFEDEIRYWLLSKPIGNRTCPNCRAQWRDNNMYINRI